MTPEDFEYFRNRASRFISGTSRRSKFGLFTTPNIRNISIKLKKSIPQQVLDKLRPTESKDDDQITTSQRDVTSLGKITLNLEQTKNNLEKIFQIIADDYKTARETNQKEVNEYRKRIANRGRVFTKKELGDSKTDLLGGIKKYVGSFFSGTGGAIRGLAMFNLLEGLLSGDISKIIGPLLGIGVTYLPAIGGAVGLSIAKSFGKGLLGFGRGGTAVQSATAGAAASGGSALSRFGKFAGKAGLVAGGIGLASSLFNQNNNQDQTQNRLEELTQQQKELVQPENILSVPQDDLRKFEELNKKFEKALDFLLAKQKETPQRQSRERGGPGPGPGSNIPISGNAPSEMKSLMDLISSPESGGNYEAMYPSTTLPGATDMTIAEVARTATGPIGRYQQKPEFLEERARAVGLDPTRDKFTPENQDKITRGHIVNVLGGDESKIVEQLKKDPSAVKKRLESSQFTGLQKYGNDFNQLFEGKLKQYKSSSIQPQALPPVSSVSRTDNKSVAMTPPQSATPIIVPMPIPQKGESQPTSTASESNDIVPQIATGYSDNFLTMYSKLTYQIV